MLKIWGVSSKDIARAADLAGVCTTTPETDGKSLSVCLTPKTLKFRKLKASYLMDHPERKVELGRKGRGYSWAICWHGHYAFMQSIFDINPDARIKSHMADYCGLQDFLSSADETGEKNMGSPNDPLEYRKTCDCENAIFQMVQLEKEGELRVLPLSKSKNRGE